MFLRFVFYHEINRTNFFCFHLWKKKHRINQWENNLNSRNCKNLSLCLVLGSLQFIWIRIVIFCVTRDITGRFYKTHFFKLSFTLMIVEIHIKFCQKVKMKFDEFRNRVEKEDGCIRKVRELCLFNCSKRKS